MELAIEFARSWPTAKWTLDVAEHRIAVHEGLP
jgi:hypothetical protein